jgi:hypothetical protein
MLCRLLRWRTRLYDTRELAVLFAALLVAMLSGSYGRDLRRVSEWRFLLTTFSLRLPLPDA